MAHLRSVRDALALAVALAAGAACGDDPEPPTTELRCAGGATGVLAADAPVIVTDDAALDLRGAAIAASERTTVPEAAVSIACADDIVPDGYVALGPAVRFGPAGTQSDRPFDLTLPYKAARLPTDAGRRHVRIVARREVGDGASFFPPLANRVIDDADPYAARISVRAGELTTYQVVAAEDAGVAKTERFAYRAIVGISMGGNAAMSIGLGHPERFDVIADLGGEPGPSMRYTLTMVREYLFGGFCTAADEAAGVGNVGELCPDQQRAPATDQFEIASDYEHMVYQEGDGVGLTLSRDFYMKAARDLARSLSNPALFNPDDPYLPPGVPADYLERDPAERCADPIVLEGFHDREFNPDGSLPVITFCDGNDGDVLGTLDPTVEADNPAEILLAVDVDGDGRRDPGEPVITTSYEPFLDVGVDGVASVDEPGYDAATNRDPAGDDYHYQRNPRGTERDLDRQDGEPFEDVGLDGVDATCQHGETPPAGVTLCFDIGEGDGEWTVSPNVLRWYESDISTRLAAMSPADRDHVAMWFDAGIRDMLNASVSANAAAGVISGVYGMPLAVYDGFNILNGSTSESSYDFTEVSWRDLPKHGYLRYGDPDASQMRIEQGDGRHVGTAAQVVNRVTTAFAWIDKHIPDGDRDDETAGGESLDGLSFVSPSTGRDSPYAIFLPPGYDEPDNADRTYPVVYFLHGYGQEPDDMIALSSIFEIYMQPSAIALDQRFQKFIIVYVDGRCRPASGELPVPLDGDLCEQGTFYKDAPRGGPAQMETNLIELMDHVDATYRARPAADVEVVD